MDDGGIMDWIEGRIRHHVAAGLNVGPAQDSDEGNQ